MGQMATSTKRKRFSRPEVRRLKELLLQGKNDILDENFHQNLTDEFNRAPTRAGSKALEMKMVQRWFISRQKDSEAVSSPADSRDLNAATDTSNTDNGPESSSDMPKEIREKNSEETEFEFEARSSRDGAWYDVGTFLTHRLLSSGEPEVRVRFLGFGAEEDEWVNVKKAVRERSIPLEPPECWKVAVGDLVLCFRERSDQAAYFDAHVLEIQKKVHDIRGCRCLFLVRYDHDQTEETVHLCRVCRRPPTKGSKS